LLFSPVKSLSQSLTGVGRGNHIGGGELSFEDIGSTLTIPNTMCNEKHVLSCHNITVPKNITSVALQYLMDLFDITTFSTF
jgi:hypothetical protein